MHKYDIAIQYLKSVAQDALEKAKHLEDCKAIDSWISVNEQMPDEETVVLVSNSKSKEVTIAYYACERWLNEKHCELNAVVTHWQPLPGPPIKE